MEETNFILNGTYFLWSSCCSHSMHFCEWCRLYIPSATCMNTYLTCAYSTMYIYVRCWQMFILWNMINLLQSSYVMFYICNRFYIIMVWYCWFFLNPLFLEPELNCGTVLHYQETLWLIFLLCSLVLGWIQLVHRNCYESYKSHWIITLYMGNIT